MNRDDDLENLGRQLSAAAPDPTDAQLERVRLRALGPAARSARASSGLLIALLTAGILSTSTGATLAVSGISSAHDASVAQYGGGVAPVNSSTSGLGAVTETPSAPTSQPSPATVSGLPTGNQATLGGETTSQARPASEQEVLATGRLPFTGYAGITAFLIGLGLLAAGLVIRRGSRAPA